jgi:mRNA-degrading endonuclease RelE of RelBE toxin-antitoxin system
MAFIRPRESAILYEVNDGIRILDIIDIGPRGDIYKR